MVRKLGRALGASGVTLVALVTGQAMRTRRRAVLLEPPEPKPHEFGDSGSPNIHLVVLGDSTSVGVGASAIDSTYPSLIAVYLSTRFRVRLSVIGRAGARMRDVASEFAPDATALSPDLVLIGVGANDVTHMTPLRSFAAQLSTALGTLQTAASEVLVALGPRFDSPLLPRPLRDFVRFRARSINRTIRRVAAEHGCEVLDLPAGLGRAFALRPDLYYCADKFHPSDAGYVLWADAMKDQVMSAAVRIDARVR